MFAASAFRKLSSIYVFSYFPFGFEGRIWDLIVSVPDNCLSFYFGNFSFPLTFCGSMWFLVWAACCGQQRDCFVGSSMNNESLIMQMEIFTGRPCVWLFSSVIRTEGLSRHIYSIYCFLTCDIWCSVWVHVRAASSEKTVPSHCTTCENVSKAYETITLK